MSKFETPQIQNKKEKERTMIERLEKELAPVLKDARLCVLSLMMALGGVEGIKGEMKTGSLNIPANAVVESVEDSADVLHNFGVSENAEEGSRKMKVNGKNLMQVAEEQLRTEVEDAGPEQKLSTLGKLWVYQKAKHLSRLNNIPDINKPINQEVGVDSYAEMFESAHLQQSALFNLFESTK